MRFEIITIFPGFFAGIFEHGIVRRAQAEGLVSVGVHDLRGFTHDRHRTVDDRPFGGGEGMVLKPEPLFEAAEHLLGVSVGDATEKRGLPVGTEIVLLSAAGKRFDQETARRFAGLTRIMLICGRYEGVDERVAEHLATEEISIGDFVLSGGELPAMLIVDAVTRLLPGSLGNEASSQNESFSASIEVEGQKTSQGVTAGPSHVKAPVPPRRVNLGNPGWGAQPARGSSTLLDFPHYTRPAEYRGWKVPDVLIGGNHAEVAAWRRAAAIEKTKKNRPDLKSTNHL
jgi:tRNA (guanine37-N1)-methyltransferase